MEYFLFAYLLNEDMKFNTLSHSVTAVWTGHKSISV